MGLWLGASILAVAQFLDYLTQKCWKKCCYKHPVDVNKPMPSCEDIPRKPEVF